MDDSFLNEREADKEVIGSLLNTNLILWRELEESRDLVRSLRKQLNRRSPMAHKLLQDENGILYIAKEVEQLAVEEVQKLYDHLKSDLALVEGYLAKELNPQPADQNAQVGAPAAPVEQPSAQPEAPAGQTVAAPAAPADPNQPPADPNATPAPVEQPAPTLDANGNPIAAPAPDANAQPEAPVMPPLQ